MSEAPVTVDLHPTTIGEPGDYANASNILDIDADVSTVSAGATAKVLRLSVFNALDLIPEKSIITDVKLVYLAKVAVDEGNPIVGIQAKTGATFEPSSPVEDEAVPTVLTERVVDITAEREWTRADLSDLAPFLVDVRSRNNGGKTSEFSWQYAFPRVTFIPPTPPTPGSKLVVFTDPVLDGDYEKVWGVGTNNGIGAEGFEWYPTGGDTRPLLDGTPNPGHRRRAKMADGWRAPGDSTGVERNEWGLNDYRNGMGGSATGGTGMLYHPERFYETGFAVFLDPEFDIANINWCLLMQMKVAQPNSGDYQGFPSIELQIRQGQFQIETPDHREDHPLWACPAYTGRWVGFRFGNFYSDDPDRGQLHVQADTRSGSPTEFVAQHDSGILTERTLATIKGDQSGPGWAYKDGDAAISHLRLGIYRNAVIPGPTWADFSGVMARETVPGGAGPESPEPPAPPVPAEDGSELGELLYRSLAPLNYA